MTHVEHQPGLPRAAAAEYELEEIHELLDDLLVILAEMRDMLEVLVQAQVG